MNFENILSRLLQSATYEIVSVLWCCGKSLHFAVDTFQLSFFLSSQKDNFKEMVFVTFLRGRLKLKRLWENKADKFTRYILGK